MTWSRRSAYLLLFAVLVATGNARAAENVWSIEYFNSRKSEWDQLTGATIRIEGRVSLAGGGQLRLAKCDIPFYAAEPLIRSLHGKKAIEITGKLKKDNGKLTFEVDKIQVLPTDLEQYESQTAKLRNARPAEWYSLADWATERSRFYDDADLGKKALAAYERGTTIEWRAMNADDASGRFQLAQKVAQHKLSESRRMELMHEGNRILWTAALKVRPADKQAWVKLSEKLIEDLPGSAQALAGISEELKGRYEREPFVVYRESPDDIRRQLHRMFHVSVLLKIILEDAAKDGSNADAIAVRLEQQVPEAKTLAEQYRLQKLNWRLGNAATSTRPEIEQLAADFRGRQQPDQARLAVTQWLRAQEPRLRPDGALGLLQLADDYLSLLQDERKAVTILAEANKLDPTFADVSDKLKAMGYANVGGTWIKSNPVEPNPAGMALPVIPGTVAIGMNASAARNAMGGRPTSLGRALTKRGVAEIWSYGQPGTTRLIIRLDGSTASEVKVVDIRNER